MAKDIAIQQQEHEQQLFGSPKTCTTFQVAKIHARMIKFYQKSFFIESILYGKVNPEKIRQNNQRFKNINIIQNKLTRFQI